MGRKLRGPSLRGLEQLGEEIDRAGAVFTAGGSIILVDLDPIAVGVLQVDRPNSVGPRVLLSLFAGDIAKHYTLVVQVVDHSIKVGRRNAEVGGHFDERFPKVALDQMNGLSLPEAEPSDIRFGSTAFDLRQEQNVLIEA